MVDRFDMMTPNSEQVMNWALDVAKALELGR